MAAIIFDFDGTIADSFAIVVGVLEDLTNHQKLSDAEIEELRGMSMLHAAKELHFPAWKLPFLVIRGRRRLTKKMARIHTHRGMVEAIRKLQAEGHQLFIMSSNSRRNIQTFLENHKMATEFIMIYGSVGLFSKARALRKIIKRNSLDPSDSWYVGDETRDIESAQGVGLRVIAVTWGYNNETVLAKHGPTALAHQPAELISILEKL